GDTFTFCVNLQNNCSDFVTFFVFTNCFFACNVPGDVRQVNQAVDAAVQADEDTEVSDRLDFTFNTVALVVGFRELLPRVSFALFQTQGDTTTFFVDIQNHNFHYIANVNNFGRVDVFVGPIHFGNVYQAFNAFFDFNEAAVVGQVGHATSQFGTFRITFSDSYPRIFAQLFQAQRYTGTFAVELQHFNSDFVAHVDDFARMLNAFPGHVSDVQQAVNAAQINECTVVSEVLNDTFNFHAFLQVFQQLIALCAVFGFDNGTTRNNNVVALLIQLDYFEFKLF